MTKNFEKYCSVYDNVLATVEISSMQSLARNMIFNLIGIIPLYQLKMNVSGIAHLFH